MTEPSDQLGLAFTPVRNRTLFSDGFLLERLPEWADFERLDATKLRDELRALWQRERRTLEGANEAQTEQRFIQPVLDRLDFSYTVQVGMRLGSGRMQPDYALFVNDESRVAAEGLEGRARFGAAVAVADAKRIGRSLDRRAGADADDPVAQIVNYVLLTGVRWGILTDGRYWRLYAAAGDLVEGACYEVDLVSLLEGGTERDFRYFAAFFARDAFLADAGGRSFLDRALAESAANAVAVGEALERQVFAALPRIAEGLLGDDERSEASLADAFDNSLVLLYRLLFCLHAEARGLLPVENPHYDRYGLRSQKQALAGDLDSGRTFSSRSDDLYNDLRALFRIVDRGDEALGVSEYDGGLFAARGHPYFEGRSVPDDLLAPSLDGLYRVGGEFVDYRALSVRHLGTIYERLLQYRLTEADGGALSLEGAPGRRLSGSYFTPEQVVDRIVERTLEPLLERRSRAIAAQGLSGEAALDAFLELRVVDPAMGSAHFLVGACAHIAQYVVTDPSYDLPLGLGEVQRLVAERCLYGVDVNPLAVELARLSLWLTTARRDEPLTFLHNLREGNSLVGANLRSLLAGGDTFFADRLAREAETLIGREVAISSREVDVHAKEELALAADRLREPLERYANQALLARFVGDGGRPFHWELEFPEVFLDSDGRPGTDGGFDAVVGNPPWVRIQALGRELAAYARREYETASGSFDAYILFLERGLSLLGPDGRLGFIVPNKLTKLDHARRLRSLLSERELVEEVIDFGDAQLFAGATNYSCILLLAKQPTEELTYRRLRGDRFAVERALADLDDLAGERFRTKALGDEPWALVSGIEAKILRAARSGSMRLDHATATIFTGLQTSADPVYIVQDRGRRGPNRLVHSRASDRELELEPELLHPLASGTEVDRYAFRPLGDLLLFPYRRDGAEMRLLSPGELERLPLTAAYLAEHEQMLRGRERGKMDHGGWYAFGRTQSLGLHDRPKLGVPRLCERLHASVDVRGEVYFDNVDVNGILPLADGPSLWTLVVLLNSPLLDYVFRRQSVPFRGSFMSANKQFIAPLPIRVPDGAAAESLDELGERLHGAKAAIESERGGFLDWLGDAVGARVAELPGVTTLARYDEVALPDLLETLRRAQKRLRVDVVSRAFRERVEHERGQSLDRLAPLRVALAEDERVAREAVYDLYEITREHRATIDADDPHEG